MTPAPSDDPPARIPSPLRRMGTDEFVPPPLDRTQLDAIRRVRSSGPDDAHRVNKPLGDYWSSRLGTAAGLRALNESFGVQCFEVPAEACLDQAAADAAFSAADLVIDVQTHFMADVPILRQQSQDVISVMREVQPDFWRGLEGMTFFSFAEFLRCVYLESDTAVAVLSAPPALDNGVHWLTNAELAGVRELIDRLAGTGRLLNHTVVHPTEPGAIESMERWRDELDPVGWKVYTMGHLKAPGGEVGFDTESGFMLDDERFGLPFLQKARELGGLNICSHKGLSMMVDNGSPRDIGPCARMFPDLNFIVYHSAFEGDAEAEGAYTDQTANDGINRLITTMRDNGIAAGQNVYAELGTTWFMMIKRPIEAAHVLGKLLLAVGEDNVLWGTDSVHYGPTQPIVDALRAFRIPDELCETHGYPQLTPEIKQKILAGNAARVYGIDTAAARQRFARDDLAWTRAALAEHTGQAG